MRKNLLDIVNSICCGLKVGEAGRLYAQYSGYFEKDSVAEAWWAGGVVAVDDAGEVGSSQLTSGEIGLPKHKWYSSVVRSEVKERRWLNPGKFINLIRGR